MMLSKDETGMGSKTSWPALHLLSYASRCATRGTGCSKWNPIEHRLFSYISLNSAGCPLRSFETLLHCLRGTTTSTGLMVRATLLKGAYAKAEGFCYRDGTSQH